VQQARKARLDPLEPLVSQEPPDRVQRVPPEHKALLAQLARKVQQGCKDRPEPKVLLERKALRGLREPLVFKEAPELLEHKALLAQLEHKGQLVQRAFRARQALKALRDQQGQLVRLELKAQLDPLAQLEPLGSALLVQQARKEQLDLMAQLAQQDLQE
jgi:hypothetical protein